MIFMALDHALYFWSSGRVNNEGLPLLLNGLVTYNPIGNSSLLGYLVMFLSSICAPGFFFIAGYVLALSIKRRQASGASNLTIDLYLWKRGLILIVLQVLIASMAFNLPMFIQSPDLSSVATPGTFLSLSVLSTIGLGFIFLSLGRRISPFKLLGATAVLYLVSQLILPNFTRDFPLLQSFSQALGTILVLPIPFSASLLLNNNFPLIPWLLPLVLGWAYGQTYSAERGISYEAKRFGISGSVSVILFFILRTLGIGDHLRPNGTLAGFFGLSKYAPSLDYFLLYLGIVFLLFFLFTRISQTSRACQILENFGRSPLFFYNLHLWLYAIIPALFGWFNILPLSLGVGIWFLGLLILYPLTKACQRWRASGKNLLSFPKLILPFGSQHSRQL